MRRAKDLISKLRATEPAGMTVPKLRFELDYLDDNPPTPPGSFSHHAAFKILKKMLQPESTLSIEDAGEKIVDMCIPAGTGSYPAAGSTDALGTMICAMAEQVPYNHPSHIKLVRLVAYLSAVTRMRKDQNEKPYRFYMDFSEVDRCLREHWSPCFENSPETANQFTEHLNFTGFLARLTAANYYDDSTPAIMAMRAGLEQEYDDDDTVDCLASAAALWIFLCGQKLFTESVQLPKPNQSPIAYFTPGPSFAGPMFGLERWEFWYEALAAVPDRKGASEECRMLAGRATDLMSAIQRDMTL